MPKTMRYLLVLIYVALGSVLAITGWNMVMRHFVEPGVDYFLFPRDVQELTQSADIIVIARVGQPVREGDFRYYGPDGAMVVDPPAEITKPTPPLMHFVDINLVVEQILKDDGTLAAGRPLRLRANGLRVGLRNPYDSFPPPATSERYLFFLGHEPDHAAYGAMFGPQGRLIINGSQVSLSNGERTPFTLNGVTTPASLIQMIREIVAGVYVPVPTRTPLKPTVTPVQPTPAPNSYPVDAQAYPTPD